MFYLIILKDILLVFCQFVTKKVIELLAVSQEDQKT